MGDRASVRVVREADFNHDGILDRIILTTEERRNKKGEIRTKHYQVEIGRPDGTYVPLFDEEALLNADPIKPGDIATYSPEYIAEHNYLRELGSPIPFAIRLAKGPTPFVSQKRIDECRAEHPGDGPGDKLAQTACIEEPKLEECRKKFGSKFEDFNALASCVSHAREKIDHQLNGKPLSRQIESLRYYHANQCFEEYPDSVANQEQCYSDRRKMSDEEILQSGLSLPAEDPQLLYFDHNPKAARAMCDKEHPDDPAEAKKCASAKANQNQPALERRFLVQWSPSLIHPAFRVATHPQDLREGQDVQPDTPAEVVQKLRELTDQKKFWQASIVDATRKITEAKKNQDPVEIERWSKTFRLAEENLKKVVRQINNSLRKYSSRIAKQVTIYPQEVLAMLDFIQEGMREFQTKDGARLFKKSPLKSLIGALEAQLKRPEFWKKMVPFLLDAAAKEDMSTGRWPFRWGHLQPFLQDALVKTADAQKLPPINQLIRLAEIFPSVPSKRGTLPTLRASIVLAMARRGKVDARATPLLEWLAASPHTHDREAMLLAAPRLMGDNAISLLLTHTKPEALKAIRNGDQRNGIQLIAYRQLAKMKIPPPWRKEALAAFRTGLEHPDVRIQVVTGLFLTRRGDKIAAEALYRRLARYVEDSRYAGRRKPVDLQTKPIVMGSYSLPVPTLDPVGTLAAQKTRRDFLAEGMETPVAFPSEDGKRVTTWTLKNLALDAIARLGHPPEAASLLEKIVAEDRVEHATDEQTLLLAAQGLVRLKGAEAVPVLIARLADGEKPSPENLLVYTVSAARAYRVQSSYDRIYQLLIHPNANVRRVAIEASASLDGNQTLARLLRDSRSNDAQVRVKVAEALQFSGAPHVAERLLEMAEDTEDAVRNQAVQSLSRILGGPAHQRIEKALAKKPELRERFLTALLRDSQSQDPFERLVVATALWVYDDERAVHQLLELLRDPEIRVRQQALISLAQMRGPGAKPTLQDAMEQQPKLKELIGRVLAAAARAPARG